MVTVFTVDDLGENLSKVLNLAAQDAPGAEPPKVFDLIDSVTGIQSFITSIADLPTNPPSLYIDVEGVGLCRHGSVSILQVYVLPSDRTYLIDIHTLGLIAFTTTTSDGTSFKSILESASIPKVFFDVRNDSDALHAHYGIKLQGIQDIQVMEFATRPGGSRFVNGLKRCIELDIAMPYSERKAWVACKDKGRKLFAPELGGTYEVFNQRPLSKELVEYCVQDVKLLPALWKLYYDRICRRDRVRVRQAVELRVRQSQSAGYNPYGKQRARGPW